MHDTSESIGQSSGHNLRFLTDAENQTTEFVYDALNRLKQDIRPLTETTDYWYDDAGNLDEKQDANGQRTEYDSDTATRLTEIRYFDSSATQTGSVTFNYDNSGNLTGYDDGTTSATYTYDDLGQKLSETVNYGTFSKTFSYTYYTNGQKKTFTMPGGVTYSYTYNNNNDLQNIRIPGVGDISYPSYTLNRPDSMTFPGGSQSYQYDALLRLETLNAPDAGLNYAYTYDNVSNILTKTTEHGNYGYGYDDVYRLTNADNPTQENETYTYDNVGNRETASGVTGTMTHNANNELTVYGDITYDYDANGNMIRKNVGSVAVNYIYNVANRLIRVEDELSGLVIAEYGYDPFGRRLWKEVDGTRTYFFYSDEGLVAEYDESGNEMRSYGYQPDSTWTTGPLWLKEGSSYYWYQNDHLGTPQKLIDGDGTVVWEGQYNAFGNAQIAVNTIENNLRFPGQYFDAETGLHYNWFRYYDPAIGRYLRVDPIGFAGGDVNLYVYVGNNLMNWVDPWGLSGNPTIITQLYPNLVRGTRTEADIHAIMLHQTGGSTAVGVFETCKLPQTKDGPAGAHYLVAKDGTIYLLAKLTDITWHVGQIKSRCVQTGKCSSKEKKKAGSVMGIHNRSEYEKKKPYPARYPFNDDTVGIEFVSEIVDDKYVPLTPQQQDSAKFLINMLKNRLGLGDDDIYRHPPVSYKEPANEACCVNW